MIWALTNEKINALRGERNKLGPSPNDCHPLNFMRISHREPLRLHSDELQ